MKQPGWAVPGVWKPEHFQAAVGSVIPAKFLSKGSRDCWPSSSVNLARSTSLSQHSLLFEVINEAFNNSRDRVYTHLLGKASTRQDHQNTVQPHQERFYQAAPKSRESLGGARREDSQHVATPVPATTGTCGASTPVMGSWAWHGGSAARRQLLIVQEESDPRLENDPVLPSSTTAQTVFPVFMLFVDPSIQFPVLLPPWTTTIPALGRATLCSRGHAQLYKEHSGFREDKN